ncbi:MAG: GSCFA domain-containing protein [Bacteroidaceae bacterium]|nr:GSCFA domain-containing protein [Bacteroidaceae bacterium]
MDFYTKIKTDKSAFCVSHDDHILVLGSCFADHVGQRLANSKFSCVVNPFGTLYNPFSILAAVEMMVERKVFTTDDLFQSQGLWHSWSHHGAFSSSSAGQSLDMINASMERAWEQLSRLDVLIVTYGTAWVYRLASHPSTVVANCHKQSEKLFIRQMEDVDTLTDCMHRTVELVHAVRPQSKVIFTVSPIRHVRDGMHANQLSKAALLLAVDKVIGSFTTSCDYFPSYEIMMDELRDYRFYDDDMVHPSSKAVDYIWERFSDTYFSKDTMATVKEWREIALGLAHRPLHADTEAYRRFLNSLLEKIINFKNKHPFLDVEKELAICNTRLEI